MAVAKNRYYDVKQARLCVYARMPGNAFAQASGVAACVFECVAYVP